MDQLVTNFAVYEESPEIGFLAEEISGAGMSGKIEAIVIGHLEAMTVTYSFNTVSDAAIKLTEPRVHNIDCRVAQQLQDKRSGKISQESGPCRRNSSLARGRLQPRQKQAENTLAIIMPCTKTA